MSLSDRLQQAKTQRLIAAGVLSGEHALKPEHAAEPEALEDESDASGIFAPITIEVGPTGLHPVAEAPRNLKDMDAAEAAMSCPNCYAHAHLDMVDLVGHTMHYTCTACGAMWQIRHVDENIKR